MTPEGWEALSLQERRVLRLLAESMPRQEIAIRLGVSRSTVDTHLKRIYAKLGVHDRMLAARAYRQATGDDT